MHSLISTRRRAAHRRPLSRSFLTAASLMAVPAAGTAFAQANTQFTPGNLVVAVEGCGVYGGTCTVVNGTGTGAMNSANGGYGDNQAAPLTLFQFAPVGTTGATYVSSLVLPQTAAGANLPVSGEYGSSSEATLQLSGAGRYLTLMGYGVNAAVFDANPAQYGAVPSLALAQSGSLTGQGYTPVPRVLALIDGNGNVDSSTAVFNVFNLNNPRSAFAIGSAAYLSGQGSGGDATSGLFYVPLYTTTTAPAAITGLDATNNTVSQDTREVQVFNGTLYTSVDTKGGSGAARSYVGTVGTPGTLPTTTVGAPVMLNNFGTTAQNGKVTITTGANSNGNGTNAGLQINLSPNNFFFASPSVLYVADSGHSKQTSATSTVGDGGLQKWVNTAADGSGTWNLAYTLYSGLGLVANTAAAGATGLYGLAGTVVNGTVRLYATEYNINDLDVTHLFGISDTLSFTTASQAAGETFSVLATAPKGSNFKGVSFAPTVAGRTTPVVSWPAEGAINFGGALSSQQLNATASVPGTFRYSPAAGTVLPAGAGQVLSVTFTPTDTYDYTTVTATNAITVNPSSTTGSALVATEYLSRMAGSINVQVTVANTGSVAVTGVVLTSVKAGGVAAAGVPVSIGTLAAGATAVVNVTEPGTVGAAGTASSVSVSGTYAGGSFGGNQRVALP